MSFLNSAASVGGKTTTQPPSEAAARASHRATGNLGSSPISLWSFLKDTSLATAAIGASSRPPSTTVLSWPARRRTSGLRLYHVDSLRQLLFAEMRVQAAGHDTKVEKEQSW